MTPNPYHDGELQVQERTGERDAAVLNGGVISDAVPAAATAFVAQQALVVAARTDPDGALWAVLLSGAPGFARVGEDRRSVELAPDGRAFDDDVGPCGSLKPDDPIGLLFVEFVTRRRLRINGHVGATDGTSLSVSVEQAYPNCPKYIQRRGITARSVEPTDAIVWQGNALTDDVVRWITAADTFLLATRAPSGAHDASHRGGAPGFAQVADGTLRIPDYPGNSMFMSLGNLALDPPRRADVPGLRQRATALPHRHGGPRHRRPVRGACGTDGRHRPLVDLPT